MVVNTVLKVLGSSDGCGTSSKGGYCVCSPCDKCITCDSGGYTDNGVEFANISENCVTGSCGGQVND